VNFRLPLERAPFVCARFSSVPAPRVFLSASPTHLLAGIWETALMVDICEACYKATKDAIADDPTILRDAIEAAIADGRFDGAVRRRCDRSS
jgi:hypothetical protein